MSYITYEINLIAEVRITKVLKLNGLYKLEIS